MWLEAMLHGVGSGASARGDMTAPLMPPYASGELTTSAEVTELSGHLIVERLELAQDSGGVGRYRGGLAVDGRYRTRDAQLLIVLQDRVDSPPWGLHGAGPGRTNTLEIRLPDGTVQSIRKVTSMPVPADTVIEYHSAGGGGYGPPEQRDVQAVHDDVREGYVSEAAARRDHPYAFEDRAPR
jgi:N-methylhydantoinase B